jgi:hypothetical protein
MKTIMSFGIALASCNYLLLASGCAMARPPAPEQLVPPTPIESNAGKFMCPYTQDEVLTRWVDKAINAEAASKVGGALGATAGSFALRQIPLVGGIAGNLVGKEIGRAAAVSAAGGDIYIRQTSDQSFDNVDDLVVWLYVKYSASPTYVSAIKATRGIYPQFADRSYYALFNSKYRKQTE